MRISKIEIQNFRSLIGVTFDLENYSLLIGPNSSGKSNVIDAIRCFYLVNKFGQSDIPKIAAVSDKEVWVQSTFEPELHEKAKAAPITYRVFLSSQHYKINQAYRVNEGGIDEGEIVSSADIKAGKLGVPIFIPAVSSIQDETKTSGPSSFREAVGSILTEIVENSTAYEKLQANIEAFTEEIKQEERQGDSFSLSTVEDILNDDLAPWGREFKIDHSEPNADLILRSILNHKIVDPHLNDSVPTDKQGTGFQRQLIFSLIKASSLVRNAAHFREPAIPGFPTLYLYEEPEAFLNPSQQSVLANNLKSISESPNTQVVASTHSPYFVSKKSTSLPSLVRLNRNNGISSIGQIERRNINAFLEENQEIEELITPGTLNDIEGYEDAKNFLLLNPERCRVFFAEQVLLVEGSTEKVVINYLEEIGIVNLHGTYVLDCSSKFNFPRFMNLLTVFRIYHWCLYDRDSGSKTRAINHEDVNSYLEEHRGDYTLNMDHFDTNLEDFLGIEPPEVRWRKPQHALQMIMENKVEEDRINAFAKKIMDLCR